ncbi:unnamed protein product [Schistosoma turkestanicum]|nr:unnamed protein product [Schistosoma turkestanicum]
MIFDSSFFYGTFKYVRDTTVDDRSIMSVTSCFVPTIVRMYISRFTVNELRKTDRLLVASLYTRKVLILTEIKTVIISMTSIISFLL